MSTRFLHCPVLNFIERSIEVGMRFDKIVKSCCEFFSHDDIIVPKKTLYEAVIPDERCIKHVNDKDNVMDIGKLLHKCNKKKQQLPKFLIYDPEEVSAASELVGGCIASAVNQMFGKLENSMHCATAQPISSLSINEKLVPSPPSYALIVKNPLKALSSHERRKNVIEPEVGLEQSGDIEIHRGKSELDVLVYCSNKAEKIEGLLKNIDANMSVKVKAKEFVGITKRVPEKFEALLTDLVKSCQKAKHSGISRAFKLYFPSDANLHCALTNSPKLGYERLSIEFYCALPRRCYKCQQADGHLAKNCPNSKVCSHCGERGMIVGRLPPVKRK